MPNGSHWYADERRNLCLCRLTFTTISSSPFAAINQFSAPKQRRTVSGIFMAAFAAVFVVLV